MKKSLASNRRTKHLSQAFWYVSYQGRGNTPRAVAVKLRAEAVLVPSSMNSAAFPFFSLFSVLTRRTCSPRFGYLSLLRSKPARARPSCDQGFFVCLNLTFSGWASEVIPRETDTGMQICFFSQLSGETDEGIQTSFFSAP